MNKPASKVIDDKDLQAALSRLKQADTDVDAYDKWDFDANPVLKGVVVKVKNTTQMRRGEEVDVRLAIIETDDNEWYTLWESANLGEFFDEIDGGSSIIVIYKGEEQLTPKKRMKVYDAYYS